MFDDLLDATDEVEALRKEVAAIGMTVIALCQDDMIKDFKDKQEARIQKILDALDACPDFKYGDHRDYLHYLITHRTGQCLFSLTKLGWYISEFNRQTSEHFKKVLEWSVDTDSRTELLVEMGKI